MPLWATPTTSPEAPDPKVWDPRRGYLNPPPGAEQYAESVAMMQLWIATTGLAEGCAGADDGGSVGNRGVRRSRGH